MTVVNGPPAASDGAQEAAAPAVGAADVPVRADGVQLIGEMQGSGYREPPALARRADGQTIQLTPLLYLVLSALDGRRTSGDVAAVVSEAFGRTVSGDNVRTLVTDQLRPAGLVADADGSQPEVEKSNPLLALRFKYAVTDPDRTRRLTAPFARLFNPVLVVAVLALLGLVSWWVLFDKGLASATHEAFERPALLALVVAVTVLSAGFHEFGHAAAARRGGATPGAMGAGVYLVWPAFYTDVTDSYRLGRWGRVVTDLGGLYFNAIVAVAISGIWWATRYDALLLVVATQILQMVRQLTPLVRFDGYHVLADVTGVPDLFQRIRPTLLGLLPWRWRHPETTVLKPWARVVVTLWVLLVVPLLALSLFVMVVALPRLLGTAWAGIGTQAGLVGAAWGDGDVLGVVGRCLAVVAVAFPIFAVAVILVRLVRSVTTRVWRGTEGRPGRRTLAAVLALALVAGLAFVWWPREGSYRPIQPYEGGTLTQVAAAVRPSSTQAGLSAGSYGRVTTAWAEGDPLPTRERPQLALVLVPRDSGSGSSTQVEVGSGDQVAPPESWVFPFNKPLEPETGDNQAMAVNTTDGTITYDVAFALVWVEDDSPALNTNEAYAFASCTRCAAVAIGFQVVLVTGDNHVAVPQNISAAVNYECVGCLTYALATQLFVTLDGPLSDAGTERLAEVWAQIAAFGANIATVPLDEIRDRLTAYEQEILAIIEEDEKASGDADRAEEETEGDVAPSGEPSPGADPDSEEDSEQSGTDAGQPSDESTGTGADGGTAEDTGSEPDSGSQTEPDQGEPDEEPSSPEPTPTPRAKPSTSP